MLSPFVYWAQSETNLLIKVDLRDVKDPDVVFENRKLKFEANGLGAKGLHKYGFILEFSNDINPEESSYKILDNKVDFTIPKLKKGWWPRLTAQIQKPLWLKVDFDRWKSEEDLDDEEVRDIREDYPDIYNKLQKEEMGYRKEDIRKAYMIIYNFICYCGFLYVIIVLSLTFLKEGRNAYHLAFETVGDAMISLQVIQIAEIFHTAFKLTKGGLLPTILQVFGRSLVLFTLIMPESHIQTDPVVFYLFLTWAAVEIVRYPYYISQLYNKDHKILTWLRYTIWIPLYPLGFFCEAVIIYKSLEYIDKENRFSVLLPNPWNFTFSFSTFLRMYLLMFMVPGIFTLMKYMYKSRIQKLSKIKKIKLDKTK